MFPGSAPDSSQAFPKDDIPDIPDEHHLQDPHEVHFWRSMKIMLF